MLASLLRAPLAWPVFAGLVLAGAPTAWAAPSPAGSPPGPPALAPRADAIELFAPRDPRVGRWFGIGTHMGLAGISSLTVGARLLGVVNPTVTLSPIGTVDATLRLNVLPRRWSPQVGVGYVLNYPGTLLGGGSGQRCAVPHGDVGVEFVPGGAFTLDAGMSIGLSECSGGTTVLPIPYVATAWYFGRR